MADKLFDIPLQTSTDVKTGSNNKPLFEEPVLDLRSRKEKELAEVRRRKVEALRGFSEREKMQDTAAGKAASLGTDNDLVRMGVGGALKGSASAFLDFPGRIIEKGGEYVEEGLDTIGLGEFVDDANQSLKEQGIEGPGTALRGAGDAVKEAGEFATSSINTEAENNLNDARISGDLFDPSSWDFGDDPNAEGYALQFAEILGQFAPQAVGLLAKSPKGVLGLMGAIGGGQVSSEQALDTEKYIEELSVDELQEESQLFRDLLNQNPEMSPEEAKRQVKKTAGTTALMTGFGVGALGGAATGYILKPLRGKLSGSSTRKVAKTGAISGTEEAIQEPLESIATRAAVNTDTGLDRDVDEDTFGDLVLGGGFGAGLGTSTSAAGELSKGTGKTVKKAKEGANRRSAKKEAEKEELKSAIESSDATPFMDENDTENRNLEKATAVLESTEVNEDNQESVKKQTNQLIQETEKDLTKAKKKLDKYTPEGVEEAKEQMAYLQQMVEDADTSEAKAKAEKDVKTMEVVLDEVTNKKARLKDTQKQYDTLKDLSNRTQALKERQVADSITASEKPVNTLKEEAGLSDDVEVSDVETQTEAAQSLSRMSMASPDVLSAPEARSLADTGQGLSDSQRTYLREYALSQEAQDTVRKSQQATQSDIFKGSRNFRGIPDYRNLIGTSMENRDVEGANSYLKDLETFAQDHDAKARKLDEAMRRFQETGEPVQVVRGKTPGDWQIAKEKLSKKAMEGNKGLTVDGRSTGLVQNVAAEAKALDAAKREMQAMINADTDSAPSQPSQPRRQESVNASQSQQQPSSSKPKPKATQAETKTDQTSTTNEPEPVTESKPISEGSVETVKRYSPEDLKTNPDKVYVFGDNLTGRGKKGQAIIRDEPNAIGIPTKRKTAMTDDAFFGQDPVGEKQAITEAVNRVIDAKKQGKTVVMPEDGIGTGLANLRENSPEVADHLQSELERAGLTETVAEPETADETPQADRAEQPEAAPAPEQTEDNPNTADNVEPNAEPEAETTQAPVEKQPGRMSIMQTPADQKGAVNAEQYFEVNLVDQYFVQNAGKDEGAGTKPLVDYKRFLAALDQDITVAEEYAPNTEDATQDVRDNQAVVLDKFVTYATDWLPALKEMTTRRKKLPREFRNKNMMDYLVDETTGKVEEENVLSAMAYAAFSYLAEQASSSAYATDGQIRGIMRKEASYEVTPADRTAFADAGDRKGALENSIGARVTQVLGLKAHKDAPSGAQSKLEATMGSYVLQFLESEGFVESLIRSQPEADVAPGTFYRLVRDWDSKYKEPVNPNVQLIGKSVRGTQGYLDTLFGSERTVNEPSFTKQKFAQKRAKTFSNNRHPENLRDIQQKAYDRPWRVRVWLNGLYQALDEDIQEGVVGIEDGTLAHKTEQASIEAKNDGKRREMRLYNEFVEDQIAGEYEREFHLQPDIWIQQRVGIKSTLNPQTGKIVRYLIGMSDWSAEVSTARNSKYNKLFRQNVAMGLGIKADKQPLKAGESLVKKMPIEGTLKQLDKLVDPETGDPVIRAALEAIKTHVKTDELSRQGQEAVRAAVKKGGEEMHTLDALQAYARMELAIENGQKTFDTDLMMMEVDGVTNGPMLTLLQLGAVKFTHLNRGGMFEEGSPFKNFVEYKADGGRDLYEETTNATARHLTTALNAMPESPGKARKVDALAAVTYFKGGELFTGTEVTSNGRNFIKTPLTGMMFGQATNAGVDSMVGELIQEMYTKLSKINQQQLPPEGQQKAASEWVKHANALIGGSLPNNHLKLDTNTSLSQLMDFEFSEEQKTSIKYGFKGPKNGEGHIGHAVKKALEEMFGTFLARRKVLNQGAQVSALMYKEVLEYRKEKVLQEKAKSGEIPSRRKKNGELEILEDLSPSEIAEISKDLIKLTPSAHTAMSRFDDDLGAGLFLPTESRTLSNDAAGYQQEVTFGKPAKVYDRKKDKIVERNTGSKPTGYKKVLQDPGVRSLILMIHSADSAISAFAYDQLAALNIHDANGLSIADVAKGAKNLNEATYEVMSRFSVPLELKNVLGRTVDGVHELLDEINGSPELQTRLNKAIQDIRLSEAQEAHLDSMAYAGLQVGPLSYILSTVHQAAYDAEEAKLENMIQMAYLDQYAQEGGEFKVTEEHRAEVRKRLEAVRDERHGGLNSEDGKRRSDKPVVKDLWKAQQIEWAVKGAKGALPTEGNDQIDLDAFESREPGINNSTEAATVLKEMAADAEKALQKEYKTRGIVSDEAKRRWKQVKRLAQVTGKTGSTKKALETMFPGESNAKKRKAWANKLRQRAQGQRVQVDLLDYAPPHIALNVIESLRELPELPDTLQEPLEKVRSYMVEEQVSLDTALGNTLSPETSALVAEHLNTFYNSARRTPWGDLGTPMADPDLGLVAFLESNENLKAGDLLNYLEKTLVKTQKGQSAFNRGLLGLLKKTVPADLPVRYITKDTPTYGLPNDGVDRSKGWYEPAVDNEHIGIKSPDFIYSGVTPELVLHEMTHRALSGVVDQAQRAGKGPEFELVQDLENLMEQTQEFLDNSDNEGLKVRYQEAMGNVHEFIAWGLTNPQFQQQVLDQVVVEDTTTNNTYLTAMRSFINKVTKLLFGRTRRWKQDERTMTTGMGMMISRASGLYAAAADRNQEVQKAQTLHSREADPFQEAKEYTTEQVFDLLGNRQRSKLEPGYEQHLKSVLNTLVEKIYGPHGTFEEQVKERANYSSEDKFIEGLMGNMPFVSEVTGQPLGLSEQEAFVLEQVEATMQASLDSSTVAYRELGKLFKETRNRLEPEDFHNGSWADATYDEKQRAKALYDFIFTPKANDSGTSNYLSRFAAMGLAYKPLRDLMGVETLRDTRTLRDMKLGDMLLTVFRRLMNLVNGRLTNTYAGQQAYEKLERLMNQLVNIKADRKASLAKRKSTSQNGLSKAIGKANEGTRKKVEAFGGSKIFTESQDVFVRSAGLTIRMVAGERADAIFDHLLDLRNRVMGRRQGLAASLVSEIQGPTDAKADALKLLRESNKNEQQRKATDENTQKSTLESFKDYGEYLTEEDKTAITRVMLRTDLNTLLDYYEMEEIIKMIREPASLEKQIRQHEKEVLKLGPQKHYWLRESKDLGYFMATNINRNDNLMFNAKNIARMLGTKHADSLSEAKIQDVTERLDPLITLYALRYTPDVDKKRAEQVMITESQQGEQSGAVMVMKLHRKLKNDALESLFEGDDVHFMKGYTKEIYNPYREVVLARNATEAENLKAMGAKPGPVLDKDPDDTSPEHRQIFTIDDGGLKSWVTGVFSLTGTNPRGSLADGGLSRVDSEGSIYKAANEMTQEMLRKKASKIAKMFRPDLNYDPARVKSQKMVPLLDGKGNTVRHRYMMNATTKDSENILERDNRMDRVLGAMAANVVDRVSSAETNAQAIEALHEQWKLEGHRKPQGFIDVSPGSEEADIRETWELLPDYTKNAIKKVWGRSGMMVPVEQYNMFFGYRKASASDMFTKPAEERNALEKIFVNFVEIFLGKKAALRVRQAGNVWGELVTMVKDFIVIKNLFTLTGNISSNVSELALAGVPMKDIVKNHRIASEGVMAYQKDLKRLENLKLMKELKHTAQPMKGVEAEIVELQDSLNRNPVKDLADAGLFQTIVEDVDMENDQYTYKSKVSKFADDKTGWVPKPIKAAGKVAVVSHDTKLYKMLYQTTHMSDFVARYTLYQHVTKNSVNKMSHEEAIQYVDDAFVNYDVPTHRFVQYLNDAGFIMFTKYYLRIQKVLFKLYRANPARALALVAFHNYFENIPTIVESGFWNRLSNPFSAGALEAPGAVGEAIPIHMATSLMD